MSVSDGNSPLPRDLVSGYRRSTSRSRSGCITCKTRHVKCDEERPHCKKCVSTNRSCSYVTYVTPKQRPIRSARETETAEHETQLPPLKYPPSTDIEGTHMERRSFHFIQARNLTYTFGKCEIDLWDTNLLQYSRRNPAVEASLLALSSIFEAYEANTMLNDGTALHVHTLHKHAFLQYTKAVSQVLHSLNSKEGDRRPTLLACLMFTWIEIMLGNLDTARRHLQSGVDIIDEIASDPVELVRKDPEDMYGALYRSFLRLRFQTTIGLRPVPQGYSRIGSNDTGDAEVSHFQSKLTQKSTMQEAKSQVWEKPFPDLDWTMQSRIRQIDRLQKADENVSLASNATDELCCRRSLSYKYIELSQAVLTLMTDARKDAKTRLDSIRWSKLLIYVDEIMLGSKPLQYSPITLDFGVFPTLFFILLWCGDGDMKCRALGLLKSGPTIEGLWRRDELVKYAEDMNLVGQ